MVDIDIPVSESLQKALQPLSCSDIRLPLPTPLKVELPFGGSMQAFVDMSKGIPNDCSMNFNLMVQIAPLLAALECPMRMLKLLQPLIKIIESVSKLQPPSPKLLIDFGEAAAELSTCFIALGKVPLMIMDLLRLVRSVLNCLLGQLKTLRDLMNGLALRFGEAEGNPDLRASIECAQQNAAVQAQALTSSIDPIAGVIALVSTVAGIVGLEIDVKLETGGAPPETTEQLDAVISVLQAAVDAISAIVGE